MRVCRDSGNESEDVVIEIVEVIILHPLLATEFYCLLTITSTLKPITVVEHTEAHMFILVLFQVTMLIRSPS